MLAVQDVHARHLEGGGAGTIHHGVAARQVARSSL